MPPRYIQIINQGKKLLQDGQADKSLNYALAAIKESPNLVQGYLLAGNATFVLRQYSRAVNYFKQAQYYADLDDFSRKRLIHAEYLYHIDKLLQQGQARKALTYADKVIAAHPEHNEAYLLASKAEFELAHYSQALSYLTTAGKYGPVDASYRQILEICQTRQQHSPAPDHHKNTATLDSKNRQDHSTSVPPTCDCCECVAYCKGAEGWIDGCGACCEACGVCGDCCEACGTCCQCLECCNGC